MSLALGRVVGSTRFYELEPWDWAGISPRGRGRCPRPACVDRAVIGHTWLDPAAQRTPVNTEAKLLMLDHAFGTWGVRAVRLQTDARNVRSRAAIERLGCTLDGVLRVDRPAADGAVRRLGGVLDAGRRVARRPGPPRGPAGRLTRRAGPRSPARGRRAATRTPAVRSDADAGRSPHAHDRRARATGTGRARSSDTVVLVVVCLAQFMVVLDVSIVNVALPAIQRSLHFRAVDLQWVVTAYALTFGGLLLLGGRLADLFGRRRIFLVGLGLFTAASLLGGFATDQATLIAARSLQGVGAAILSPATLTILTVTFTDQRARAKAFGVWSAVAAGGGAAGALFGGMLTQYLSWRWILFVNVPIGIALFAVARLRLHESRAEGPGAGSTWPGRSPSPAPSSCSSTPSPTPTWCRGRPPRPCWCWPPRPSCCSPSSSSRPGWRPTRWCRCACSGSARSPGPTWSCSASASACSPCGSSSRSTSSRCSATARWSPG